MNLILAALQGLASLPKLIEAMERLQVAWREREKAEYRREVSLVIERLRHNVTEDERKHAARELQNLIARL